MPRKESPEVLLRKYLGPEAGDAVLKRIDEMVAAGEKRAAIEEAVNAEIAAHIENAVKNALAVKIGPMEPSKIEPLQASIHTKINSAAALKLHHAIATQINATICATFDMGPPVEIRHA